MAGTLSRFFASASSAGAFASIRADSKLLASAQNLYDQILPSAAVSTADEHNARSGDNEPDKIWALVAVVATGMTQEMKHEKTNDVSNEVKWHLVQILAEAGVGLQEFLLYFTSLFNRLLLEPELLAATTQLKEEFTIATLLFEKYRVLWEKLTKRKKTTDPEPERQADDQLHPELKSRTRQRKLFEGGWLVFLLAKRTLSSHYSGLGQLYNLLLATLHLVSTNAQASQATVEAEVAAALSAMGGALGDGKASPMKSGAGVRTSAQILEALCAAPKVDPADVSRASEHLGLVLQHLRDEKILQKEEGEHTVLSIALFSDAVLEANVARLSERYNDDYLDSCGKLDERFFLDARTRRTIMGMNLTAQTDTDSSASNSSTTTRSAAHGILSPIRRNMMARRRENGNNAVARGTMTPPRHHQQNRGGNSPMVHSWQWQGSPSGTRFLPSGVSPRPSPSSMRTPVSAAVETNNWVREILSSTMLTPATRQLREFFSDCTMDPTDRIARVLQEHSELLLAARTTSRVTSGVIRTSATLVVDDVQDSNGNETGSGRNAQFSSSVDDSLKRTQKLAVVLFYRVLEPLLLSERERLRNNDFSRLLNNEVFLAALFACSAEVVLKAHSLITISYPFLLDHLHVNAFHFVTTSESFVKYAPKLPAALKKHMGDVKNRILDSRAWRSDSALYQLLAGANRLSSSAPAAPLSASPKISLMERINGTGAATPSGAAGHAPVLRLFFRMVLSRAASRIYQLCNLLSLDSTDQNQIWTAVKECITTHHYLLKDRHLDLIVLCNIYAVCKVSRGPNVSQAAATMSFKRLLVCYRQLNRQTPTGMNTASGSSIITSRIGDGVTHNIKLESEHSRGDIIKFYNRCYITPMKVFILQFQFQESQMAAADAVVAEASDVQHVATPGFTRREGGAMGLAASTSDSESIARAASEAVQRLLHTSSSARLANDRSRVPPITPPRSIRRGVQSSPFVSSPAVSALQMFTSAEVQMLPVSMHQTSPKRVQSSNVFMSSLQQVRLDRRSEMTPRSHALYAFGESPARDLALINRAVNAVPASLRRNCGVPQLDMDSDTEQDVVSASPSARKKQKTLS